MPQPFVGELRIFAGSFAPAGWQFCEGQTLSIAQNSELFNLIGTTFGGDGQTTFALPDLRGRIPVHEGQTITLGEATGVEEVTLTQAQLPSHTHSALGSAANGTSTSPTGNVVATMPEVTTFAYGTDLPPTTLNAQSISPVGGSQPHTNLQPYVCINYIISLFGIFPSPT